VILQEAVVGQNGDECWMRLDCSLNKLWLAPDSNKSLTYADRLSSVGNVNAPRAWVEQATQEMGASVRANRLPSKKSFPALPVRAMIFWVQPWNRR
jgi:hypothetical protein